MLQWTKLLETPLPNKQSSVQHLRPLEGNCEQDWTIILCFIGHLKWTTEQFKLCFIEIVVRDFPVFNHLENISKKNNIIKSI